MEPIELAFDRLEQAGPYAERLAESGYESAGRWTLAQAADHCATWIDLTLTGNYPRPPRPMRPIFWIVSRTVGPWLLRRMIRNNAMASGSPTIPETVPPGDGVADPRQDAAAAMRLTNAADHLAKYEGPIPRSPLYGSMNAQEARELHRIHTAHHLRFLVPREVF